MAFGFYEVSAKTGENVQAAFQRLAYHITDICHPKLMKSYHPHCEKPMMSQDVTTLQVARLREFKGKGKKNAKKKEPHSKTENRTNQIQYTVAYLSQGTNISSCDNATRSPSLFTCCICFNKHGKTNS